jgi:hydroxyacylglutathione hydrolase
VRALKALRAAVLIGALAGAIVIAGAALAPYVYAELIPWLDHHDIVDPRPASIARGSMVDDYFAVEQIGPATYAIGEPRYYQRNYSYLIIGERRALLFDSGSGTRDIAPVVAALTSLPVTVMVSHLHFDHLGGIGAFGSLAMIDLPQTRARFSRGLFTPSRYEYLGFIDAREPPSARVSQWLTPGARIDLGGRVLTVLSTPGHTPTSIALSDSAAPRLFIGDFIYPTTLYAFLPGASLSVYQRSAEQLLATLPGGTILWTAHCCRHGEGVSAPWLDLGDLRDLDQALVRIRAGRAASSGFYPRRFAVNDQMTLNTGFAWNNH